MQDILLCGNVRQEFNQLPFYRAKILCGLCRLSMSAIALITATIELPSVQNVTGITAACDVPRGSDKTD
jgi:hypothetical protein